jgi:hypothetical protein
MAVPGSRIRAVTRAVAWVPMAPVVVPEIGGPDAADAVLVELRAAVGDAVTALTRSGAPAVAVLAPTDARVDAEPPATWSWHGFGVGARPVGAPLLPWPLGLGARLLDDAGWQGGRRYLGVAGPADLTGRVPDDVALLVLGDGSACHGDAAPGGPDPRADAWDAALVSLLAAGDIAGLAGLDPALGEALRSTAAVSFPAAAGVLLERRVPPPVQAEVRYAAAPYGVGYLVATWHW